MEEKCELPHKKGYDWTTLWKTEDWVAVWLGFLIIVLVLAFNQWKIFDLTKVSTNIKWATDGQISSRAAQWKDSVDPLLKDAQAKEELGTANRLQALKDAIDKGNRQEIADAAARVERIGGIPGAVGKDIGGHARAFSSQGTQSCANS